MALDLEAQFHTGLGGTPPHIDVTTPHIAGFVVAIESKFTGHLKWSTMGKSKFAASYLDTVVELQALTGSAANAKPKPRWDVHLQVAGNFATAFQPLIEGPSGSAVSLLLSG